MTKVSVGRAEPVAYVTKGKQRIKQYKNQTVYLNNGEEFELELFNPTSHKVLAKIYLNEESIGAGIVLRPGERAFIERFIDVARKFVFKTYEVDGRNEQVKKAIANNGDVRVAFYKEETPTPTYWTNTWTTTWPTWGTYTYTDNTTYGTPTFGPQDWDGNLSGSIDLKGVSNAHTFYSNSMSTPTASLDSLDFMAQDQSRGIIDMSASVRGASSGGRKMSKSISKGGELKARSAKLSSRNTETGRVDKGSHSSQTFGHDYSSFEYFWTWETKWKILPTSQKPVLAEDMKVHCTNCGAKQKKLSHKFCPICGEQYE